MTEETLATATPSETRQPTKDARPSGWKIILAFAAVYLIWGSTYLAIKFAIETLPPFLIASTRFFISGFSLYVLGRILGEGRPTWGQWRNAAVLGCLMFLGGNGLVFWAEQTVPSGIAALMIATVPLWMVGLDAVVFKRTVAGVVVWIGLVLGLLGVMVLLDPFGDADSRVPLPGAFALIAACFFWSLGSLWGRGSDLPKSLLLTSGMQMLGGAVGLLITSACFMEWNVLDIERVSAKSLWAVAYLSLAGGMVAFSCFFFLLRSCDTAVVSTYAYVNPVIAVGLGYWLGDESFTTATFLGASLVICAVILIVTFRPKPRAAAE